jgi:glycosyltransferase involved in cell wall biosynthesis
MSVLRVIHVALQLDTGGMERLLVEFARHCDAQRYALRFVSLGSRGAVAEELEGLGWPVTCLGARPGLRPAIGYRLARLFRDHGADVVHVHNTKPLLYAAPAARLARTGAVVYTRHGQRRGATGRQDALFRMAARCADRIVCVSDDAARLCGNEGVRPGTVRTIPNGIDVERFCSREPCAGGPAVFVGRLSSEKDVQTLLRAMALVVQRRPSFRLAIAGDGPCAADLKMLSESLGLGPHVQFLGEVRDVPALYSQASMFILSSVTEGLPLTVLEAMACGLPVVATRVGGTPEAVVDGTTGVLVPPGEPAALAEAILRIAADDELARRMGAAGRRRAEANSDVRTMVGRYESLYQEILGRERAPAA